jgi:hypothetical protein
MTFGRSVSSSAIPSICSIVSERAGTLWSDHQRHPGCGGVPGAAGPGRSYRRDSARTGGRQGRPRQTCAAGLFATPPQAWQTALRLRAARIRPGRTVSVGCRAGATARGRMVQRSRTGDPVTRPSSQAVSRRVREFRSRSPGASSNLRAEARR